MSEIKGLCNICYRPVVDWIKHSRQHRVERFKEVGLLPSNYYIEPEGLAHEELGRDKQEV